jgi:cysteine desulfurase/selenocysteine lyase
MGADSVEVPPVADVERPSSAAGALPPARPFDVVAVRAEFPILAREIRGRPLAYLDSAASAQKPEVVLAAMDRFLRHHYANVHRSVHRLAEEATAAYESARQRIAAFLGAAGPDEIVFTRGATEALNLLAQSLLPTLVRRPGEEILVSTMEHHANLVSWQLAAERLAARVVPIPISDAGEIDRVAYRQLLERGPRLVAVAHVSNVLGTVNPIRELAAEAHAAGALLVVDGAQAVHHLTVDLAALGADAYAFSAHKTYGPTGFGVLWARRELLAAMPPWQGGGDMIRQVSFSGTTFADPPQRFEAGTPHLTGAVGLAAALDWLSSLDRVGAEAHEQAVLARAVEGLSALPGVRILGAPRQRVGAVSFVVDGVHPHDLATILDRGGVAIRAGHHCAQPLHERYGLAASARASVAVHTTADEIDRLLDGVERARSLFGA